MRFFPLILSISLSAIIVVDSSCTKSSSDQDGLYFPTVKVIIQDHCFSCHNSAGTWEGRPTAFDNDSEIVASAFAIKSAVADSVTMVNKRMPKDDTLAAANIDVIVKWYEKGGRSTD